MAVRMKSEHDYAAQARQAIEIVCSGDVLRMEEFYSPDFVDHVNNMTFHGYEGGRESLAFYGTLFKGYRMGVEEQVTEGKPGRLSLGAERHLSRPSGRAPRRHDQPSR
jgi:hypothetical protein